MNGPYSDLAFAVINVAGFWIESFLVLYLLTRFFTPRRGEAVPCVELVIVSALIAGVLLTVDLAVGEPYSSWVYLLALCLLPLIYACLRLDGSIVLKVMICFLFLLMNLLLESIVVVFRYLPLKELTLFSFRRILCKPVLYLVIRFLLINMSRMRVTVSRAYWVSLTVICGLEYLLLPPIISGDSSLSYKLMTIALCVFVPLSFYYTITRLVRVMEINQVYLAQYRQLELSQQYLTQVDKLSESLRRFRHDYKAHLFCMDALLSQSKYDELHQYLVGLHQITPEMQSITRYTLNEPVNIILNQKAEAARNQGISMEINVVYPEVCKIRDIDLVTLISNLLDNAIEAAIQSSEPWVQVDVRQEKAYLRLEVANATADDVLKSNPKLTTTKPEQDAHGLGLKIVQNIVAHYDGMYQVTGDEHSLKVIILLCRE